MKYCIQSLNIFKINFDSKSVFLLFYRLFAFPTTKRKPEERAKWKHLINRLEKKGKMKLWLPSKDSRVCSLHFIDGKPTDEHPFPTENLGYDCSARVKNVQQSRKKKKISYNMEFKEKIVL